MNNRGEINMELEYYIILTKYGFVQDILEDYTDLIEDNPLWKLYNAKFIDNPSKAMGFMSKSREAPKYACSSEKAPWEMTVEEWVNEIGGELVKLVTTTSKEIGYQDGNTTFQEISTYLVDKDLSKIKFEFFPYDELEDDN